MTKRGPKGMLPEFVPPCLARLGGEPPEGDQWGHEVKFDGYRLEPRIERGRSTLLTRSGLDWSDRFGKLSAEIASLPARTALIDGEAIVEDHRGRSDFSELVAALKSGRPERIVFVAFDLLFLDGRDLTALPLLDRKTELKALLVRAPTPHVIRYSDHIIGRGKQMLSEVCKIGLEGIVSKRLDAPYRSGRGDSWRKIKCYNTDEFVVIGYLDSTAEKNAVGALVLGYFEERGLRYAGRVGTGFSSKTAGALWSKMQSLKIAAPVLTTRLNAAQRNRVRWLSPELVAQIEYRGWTSDGLLRHAAFKALRDDIAAGAVKRP